MKTHSPKKSLRDGRRQVGSIVFSVVTGLACFFAAAPGARAVIGAGESADYTLDTRNFAEFGNFTFGTGAVGVLADSGAGSLRDSIAGATSGDTLTFDPGVSGQTITLSSGQLTIDADLAIDASTLPGGITISGNSLFRVFEVSTATIVTMNSLTITDGVAPGGPFPQDSGGGILNAGNLTVENSTLTGNTASFGGGGIANTGTLAVNNATLSGNSAGAGGGIGNNGTVNLNHVTLSSNNASLGGGIVNDTSGTIDLNNTLIAQNTAPPGASPDIRNLGAAGTITSTGVNFVGDPAGSTLTAGPSVVTGESLLAPLDDYGGRTATMPPLPGSPAIEGAVLSGSTPANDQRGLARPNGPQPDIGAVEAASLFLGTLADSDGDEIPDIFEGPDGPYPHLTVGIDDIGVDTDGDGSPDAEEISNMTDLFDIQDFLRIISVSKGVGFDVNTNPVFDISWRTFPSLNYSLECDTALNFGSSTVLGPVTAGGFLHSATVLLDMGGRDFVRAKRE